jgi:hypothetical protein
MPTVVDFLYIGISTKIVGRLNSNDGRYLPPNRMVEDIFHQNSLGQTTLGFMCVVCSLV